MKDFTGWNYYSGADGENVGITIIRADGSQESRLLIDADVVEWLAAGNTPLPAE